MKALKHVIGLAMLVFSLSMQAQTDIRPILTTNFITADPSFREVDGKLYNTARSVLFHDLSGRCDEISPAFMLVDTFTMEPVTQAVTERHMNFAMGTPTGGYHDETHVVQIGEKETQGPKIILLNYSPSNPALGEKLSFRAIQMGTTNYQGSPLELWDYGTPHVVMVVHTNYVKINN